MDIEFLRKNAYTTLKNDLGPDLEKIDADTVEYLKKVGQKLFRLEGNLSITQKLQTMEVFSDVIREINAESNPNKKSNFISGDEFMVTLLLGVNSCYNGILPSELKIIKLLQNFYNSKSQDGLYSISLESVICKVMSEEIDWKEVGVYCAWVKGEILCGLRRVGGGGEGGPGGGRWEVRGFDWGGVGNDNLF